MLTIVFKTRTEVQNDNVPPARVFRVQGVKMSSNVIYGVFNGNEHPIATSAGDLWRVDNKIYNVVEVFQTELKKVEPQGDDGKAA